MAERDMVPQGDSPQLSLCFQGLTELLGKVQTGPRTANSTLFPPYEGCCYDRAVLAKHKVEA